MIGFEAVNMGQPTAPHFDKAVPKLIRIRAELA